MNTATDVVMLRGTLLKVVATNEDVGVVHARYLNGQVTVIQGLGGILPVPGDIILLGEERWQHVPNEMWPETTSIGIVRKLLDDGDVLLDTGLGISRVTRDDDLAVAINNTVEYNDEGILRKISDGPIRSRDGGSEGDDVLKEYLFDKSGDGPSFDDFGGYPEVISRARELIETQLQRRETLEKIGARPVKGILFTGPPGTGKTYLARIIAHEAAADFFLVSGPSIVSKWVGDSEDTLRRIFEAASASKSGRAIVFFDEIDSIAERRTGDSHEASKRLVAQLLTLMDGFDSKDHSVVVIAATNRVETLDPALTRPGRFDWEIEFGMPSRDDRVSILSVGAKPLQTEADLPIEEIAQAAEGWSAAQLTSIWTEAALFAAGDGRDRIAGEDLARAYERVAKRPRREYVGGGR